MEFSAYEKCTHTRTHLSLSTRTKFESLYSLTVCLQLRGFVRPVCHDQCLCPASDVNLALGHIVYLYYIMHAEYRAFSSNCAIHTKGRDG